MTDHRHDSRQSDDRFETMLRDAAPQRFAVGFTGRVTERLARERALLPERTIDFSAALERHFKRIVPILAAASVILGIYSWWGGRNSTDSLLDATLRLPQVSVSTAYTSEALFGEDGTDGGDN